jgi:hypothetical protein
MMEALVCHPLGMSQFPLPTPHLKDVLANTMTPQTQ